MGENGYDFLNHLVGQWRLTGMMGDVTLQQKVTAKWVLGGTFLWMYFTSTTPEDNPTAGYEAVYHLGFNEAEQIFVMHLLDTTEVPTECVMGRGKREGNSIPFVFEYGTTNFCNTFVWHPERDSWSFRQTYEEDGTSKTFATKEMTRMST